MRDYFVIPFWVSETVFFILPFWVSEMETQSAAFLFLSNEFALTR